MRSNNILVGIFGHINHGKTAFIKSINNFDGDDTKLERERGMSINLSFSSIKKDDKNIFLIDAPGHKNFIKKAIVGANGCDYAIVIIDANEGLMPQSYEHLKILNYLNIKDIIIVFSKTDKCKNFIADEILSDEIFDDFNILKTFKYSIYDTNQITNIKEFLLNLEHKKRDNDQLYGFVTKKFQKNGIGNIINLTLISGSIKTGDRLFTQNGEILTKSIECLNDKVDEINAPARVGLSIKGEIGDTTILTNYKLRKESFIIDCKIIGDLSHNKTYTIMHNSFQSEAKFLRIDDEFGTFKLKAQRYFRFDDRIIVLNNNEIIGYGIVLIPFFEPIKKLIINDLYNKNFKNVFSNLANFHKFGFGLISSKQRFNLSYNEALEITNLIKDIFVDEKNLCIYPKSTLKIIKNFIKDKINNNKFFIISIKFIEKSLKIHSKNFIQIAIDELIDEKFLKKEDNYYTFINSNDCSSVMQERFLSLLDDFAPKNINEIYKILQIDSDVGDDFINKLLKSKKIIKMDKNFYINSQTLYKIVKILRENLEILGMLNVQNTKDILKIPRKFIIIYLEFLDNFDDIRKDENQNRFLKTADNGRL